jgi:hypothetical protein
MTGLMYELFIPVGRDSQRQFDSRSQIRDNKRVEVVVIARPGVRTLVQTHCAVFFTLWCVLDTLLKICCIY